MTTRIMVVDDEPAIGKLLLYQLGGFGYHVQYFQDALEALQRLPAVRPDLVLLDVMMPLMSGWEVCRQIRACSSIPIIMLTAKGADSDVVTGLGAGADDYVTKPFSMTQLQARIEAVLRRAPAHPPLRALERGGSRVDAHLTAVTTPATAVTEAPPTQVGMVDHHHMAPAPPAEKPHNIVHVGRELAKLRHANGLTLHQIERAIKIRWEFLQAIEQENWSYVPNPELRRAVLLYSDYLGFQHPALGKRLQTRSKHSLEHLPFAAAFAVVLVLVVVGMYLF